MKTMTVRIISLLLLIVSLHACQSNKPYSAELDSWVGRDISELKEFWGDSQDSFTTSNGNRIYVWEQSATYTLHAQNEPRYSAIGNQVFRSPVNLARQEHTFWCRTQFEVDAKNLVIAWEYEGNDCRRIENDT